MINSNEISPIFIVGNSRSGTTLTSNILKSHPLVYSFPEIHFFEQLWNARVNGSLDFNAATTLGAKLIGIARESRHRLKDVGKYYGEAKSMLSQYDNQMISAIEVYKTFLMYESKLNGKKIPCEQTPNYIFYLKEILEVFPEARVIVLLRDPRDILLSQKNKWKQYRSSEGATNIREQCRAWANYHPILISQMWKRAMESADQFNDDIRVKRLYFEELVNNSRDAVLDICKFLGIPFYEEMLNVPASRSVLSKQQSEGKGISVAPVARWKTMLQSADIYWCQKIAGDQMIKLGYRHERKNLNWISIGLSASLLPIKASIALALNFSQSRDLVMSIRRRFIG